MSFKLLPLFTAALTIGFNSCSSEADEVNSAETDNTRFTLTIANPVTYADDKARSEEVAFKSVDVYIYKANGSFERHEYRDAGDFAQNPTSGVYELKSEKRIPAFTGEKKIYVGVNLSSTLATAIANNGPSAVATITQIADLKNATNGFAMFSETVAEKTLVEDETQNVVPVKVSRLVAKTVFYTKETTYTVKGAGGTAAQLNFTVGNVNNKFYPLRTANYADPNFTPADETKNFFHPGSGVDAYQQVNAIGVGFDEANTVYASENTVTGTALEGSVTYGIVRVLYTPAKTVYFAEEGDADSELRDNTTPTAGTIHWVKTTTLGNLFFSELEDAKAFVKKHDGNTETDIYTYTNGFMYYKVWLKDNEFEDANKYSVHRNTIYKVTVTDINGLGSNTDQPGTPENPGIIDPNEPIDEELTKITVNVEIVNWNTGLEQSLELQGK